MAVVRAAPKKVKLSKKEHWKHTTKIAIGFDDHVLTKEAACCWHSCVTEEGLFSFDSTTIDGGKG